MVVALAFVATVVSSLFAQSMLVRYTRDRGPQDGAWALALGMFALASVALATGTATGWDTGTFRVFYLFGAVLDVPWLALGTVYLLAAPVDARRCRQVLLVFSGFAAGVLASAPMEPVHGTAIPVGKHLRERRFPFCNKQIKTRKVFICLLLFENRAGCLNLH